MNDLMEVLEKQWLRLWGGGGGGQAFLSSSQNQKQFSLSVSSADGVSFHLELPVVQLGVKSKEAERHINKAETETLTVSFEPASPCWVEFDIQAMRQGSTQGGRPPCNMNSHLESSCGCEHETLKETAAMDPGPSHHLSHSLKAPFP